MILKLNPDCIRDILLDIEATSTINTGWKYDSRTPSSRLSHYDRFEIAYQARYCAEANLISGFSIGGNSESVFASDLTPNGHEFLANIRNDTFFNKVKDIAKELCVESLPGLQQIALNAALVVIKSHFSTFLL